MDNVKKMLLNEQYNIQLNDINYFFFEKLISPKNISVLLFLIENHYIDQYIDDLFVYIAPAHFELLTILLHNITNNFTLEKAFVNIIRSDNLKTFCYLLDNLPPEQFPFDFLIFSLQCQASKIREYILKHFLRKDNQTSFNRYVQSYKKSYVNFKLVKHLVNYGYKLPPLPECFFKDLLKNNLNIAYFLIKNQCITINDHLYQEFLSSSTYQNYQHLKTTPEYKHIMEKPEYVCMKKNITLIEDIEKLLKNYK